MPAVVTYGDCVHDETRGRARHELPKQTLRSRDVLEEAEP